MDNMDDFLSTHSTPSGAINWFDNFIGETIPKKRFKPYNHNKRKRWKIESYQVIRYDDSMSDW